MKKCYRCCKNLPLGVFDKDSQKKDGHRHECKSCRNKKDKIPEGFKQCVGKYGCGKIKPLCEFKFRKDTKKYTGQCIDCRSLYFKGYDQGDQSKYIIENSISEEEWDVYRKLSNKKHKICMGCDSLKPLESFSRQKEGKLGRRARCKKMCL